MSVVDPLRSNQEHDMPRKKKVEVRRLIVPENATLEEIYAIARKEFTAADLQKYTVDEPMVPFDQTLAELEKLHEELTRKRRKKRG
jgi:hypothetical protein